MNDERRAQYLLTAGDRPAEGLAARLAGSEGRRFIVGSVIVPLFVAGLLVVVGAWMASLFQDRSHRWQEERARAREVADGLRNDGSDLFLSVGRLALRGRIIERTTGNVQIKISEQVDSVDSILISIAGWSAIREQMDGMIAISGPEGVYVDELVAACKQSVDVYLDCITARAIDERVQSPNEVCTDTFRASSECADLTRALRSVIY